MNHSTRFATYTTNKKNFKVKKHFFSKVPYLFTTWFSSQKIKLYVRIVRGHIFVLILAAVGFDDVHTLLLRGVGDANNFPGHAASYPSGWPGPVSCSLHSEGPWVAARRTLSG